MTEFALRPFTPDDYDSIADVANACFPECPETPDEMRHHDDYRAPGLHWARWVAVANGQVAGYSQYTQDFPMYHPRKFGIDTLVLPEYRGSGIGKALYCAMWDGLAPLDPLGLRTHARETELRGIRFLTDRDFAEVQREQESLLKLSNWNPAAWGDSVARVKNAGVRLASYAALTADAPCLADLHQRLDDLHWAISQDIPHSEPPVRAPHSEFIKRFERPDFLPEGNLFALDGDVLIGVSVLWGAAAINELYTGTTGVLRTYRKRGIATALKVKALTFAKSHGADAVRTFNEVNNRGMLEINRHLGFVPQPAWIEYRKALGPESDEESHV